MTPELTAVLEGLHRLGADVEAAPAEILAAFARRHDPDGPHDDEPVVTVTLLAGADGRSGPLVVHRDDLTDEQLAEVLAEVWADLDRMTRPPAASRSAERAELIQLGLKCSREAHLALAARPRDLAGSKAWTEAAAEILRQYEELVEAYGHDKPDDVA